MTTEQRLTKSQRATLRGILDALAEDADDETSWCALADFGEEHDCVPSARPRISRPAALAQAALEACLLTTDHYEARSKLNGVELHPHYCETGYDQPTSGVIATGSWNNCTEWRDGHDPATHYCATIDDTPGLLGKILEGLDIECEWSDEWSTCSECGGLVRDRGNSYDWEPSYCEACLDGPGEIVCLKCCSGHDPEGPQEDDYATEDYVTFHVVGRHRTITVPDGEDWRDVIAEDMGAQGWYPNVWQIDDHGGATPLSLNREGS